MNDHGKFLKIFEILRNGKEFCIFILGDSESSGWVNIAHILRGSFGGEIPLTQSVPPKNFEAFPPLN